MNINMLSFLDYYFSTDFKNTLTDHFCVHSQNLFRNILLGPLGLWQREVRTYTLLLKHVSVTLGQALLCAISTGSCDYTETSSWAITVDLSPNVLWGTNRWNYSFMPHQTLITNQLSWPNKLSLLGEMEWEKGREITKDWEGWKSLPAGFYSFIQATETIWLCQNITEQNRTPLRGYFSYCDLKLAAVYSSGGDLISKHGLQVTET